MQLDRASNGRKGVPRSVAAQPEKYTIPILAANINLYFIILLGTTAYFLDLRIM